MKYKLSGYRKVYFTCYVDAENEEDAKNRFREDEAYDYDESDDIFYGDDEVIQTVKEVEE